MENRNGLLVKTRVTLADGGAERDAALGMAKKMAGRQRLTLGGDKNYDTRDFVRALRRLQVTPHVAQNTTNRSSAIDGRTTRHPGYALSQQKRKRVEQSFGWDEDDRDAEKGEIEGPGESRLVVHLRGGRVQPGSVATVAGRRGSGMKGQPVNHHAGPQRTYPRASQPSLNSPSPST